MFSNSLRGKAVLDFGCGAGRSTMFVKALGARTVIGADINKEMIRLAKKKYNSHGLAFYNVTGRIPFRDSYFDSAFTAHMLVESRTTKEMLAVLTEIYRVLKPSSTLVIVTSNPKALGHEYKVGYTKRKKGLKSGDRVDTVINGRPSFTIKDTYWTEQDYHRAISQAGFKLVKASYPLAKGKGWLDETKVAPNIVYKCMKT